MADILILGMEMPKRYEILCLFSDGSIGMLDTYSVFNPARPIDCAKAVSLPEGYGDLIDRDAFRAENGLNAKCEHCPTNTYECQHDMIHTKMDFCGMLDDATVIVPAEGGNAVATKEELFAAVRLIKQHCKEHDSKYCRHECPFSGDCGYYFVGVPGEWCDPEERGGEDG